MAQTAGCGLYDSNGNKVGQCHAKVIDRELMLADFFWQIDEPSEATSDMAFGIFDRWGNLQKDYISHPVKKGTGVWGKELNKGSILFIESIEMDKDHRRQEHGMETIRKLWKQARKKSFTPAFAIVLPMHPMDRLVEQHVANLSPAEEKS